MTCFCYLRDIFISGTYMAITYKVDIVVGCNFIIALENGLENKKIYMFHIMVLKHRFLCVIWKSICPTEETLMIRLENGLEGNK